MSGAALIKALTFLMCIAVAASLTASPTFSQKPPVVPPRITKNVKPDCGEGKSCHGLHGVVVVTVDVLTDGTVGDADIKSESGDKRLAEDAIKAAKQCRFVPGKFNGKPTSMNYDLEYRF